MKKRDPDVSVVMGVHNGAQYFHETIPSVLSQTGINLEFIIVDDGSDAETADALASYSREDRRIQIIRQPRAGLTKALITGCARATGRYIARQDNGDYSLPDRLLAQMRALDADESLSFVSCWTEMVGPESEFLSISKGSGIARQPSNILSADSESGLLDGPSSHPSVMMRRYSYERVGGYRAQFYFAQDWDLWARLAEVGNFQLLDRALLRCRVMPDSLSGRYKIEQDRIVKLSRESSSRRRMLQSDEDILQIASTIRPGPQRPICNRQLARGYYFIGQQLQINSDRRATDYLKRSTRIYPLHLKSWIRLAQIYVDEALKRG